MSTTTVAHKYDIGQKFTPRGKNKPEHTIIDIHFTYNAVGELVKVRYVTMHDFCGQPVIDRDVTQTTIDMAKVPPA